MKKLTLQLLFLFACTLSLGGILHAQEVDNGYAIIPELQNQGKQTGDAAIQEANEHIQAV
jgi:hypothetical protein